MQDAQLFLLLRELFTFFSHIGVDLAVWLVSFFHQNCVNIEVDYFLNSIVDIAQKNAESDYGKIKDEIVLSAQQINQGIIKALNNAPRSGIN